MNQTLWQSLARQAGQISCHALAGVESLQQWENELPGRRLEFAKSLGLDPLPERCDLQLTVTGTFSGQGYRAKKVGYQILPDCWGSGIIYYPDPLPAGPLPAVLYVCGHGKIGVWFYQAHPALWARRGYVCLIVDSIEQHDNPGEHHGFLTHQHEQWISLGYCPAGGETFNNMRALDVLCSDPVVDPERIGITGVSGGGAQSFYTSAMDPRVKAVSTLCGLSSPVDAIANKHMLRHCDCMYVWNLFQRDLAEFAALIAPRAVQFCFGDHDTLFHREETTALAERAKKVFGFYGRDDAWRLVRADCPHGDHPDFDKATQEWFDLHVAGGEPRPILELGGRELSEQVLSVFHGTPPTPNRLGLLPELLSDRGTIPLPQTPEAWPAIRAGALASLPHLTVPAKEVSFCPDGEWKIGENGNLQTHSGSIDGVGVRMEILQPDTWVGRVVLTIAGGGESELHARARAQKALPVGDVAICSFAPRLSGTNYPGRIPPAFPGGAESMPPGVALTRSMILLGQTPVMMFLEDLRVAISYLRSLHQFANARVTLHGCGEVAVAVLYAALADESIHSVVLERMPSTHVDGAPVPGILRVLDIPQAVGLMAPRRIALVGNGHAIWTWAIRAYERVGAPSNRLLDSGDTRDAFSHALNRATDQH